MPGYIVDSLREPVMRRIVLNWNVSGNSIATFSQQNAATMAEKQPAKMVNASTILTLDEPLGLSCVVGSVTVKEIMWKTLLLTC